MLGVTDIWTYVIGTVAIILLPGPNSLYVLSTAARPSSRPLACASRRDRYQKQPSPNIA